MKCSAGNGTLIQKYYYQACGHIARLLTCFQLYFECRVVDRATFAYNSIHLQDYTGLLSSTCNDSVRVNRSLSRMIFIVTLSAGIFSAIWQNVMYLRDSQLASTCRVNLGQAGIVGMNDVTNQAGFCVELWRRFYERKLRIFWRVSEPNRRRFTQEILKDMKDGKI